MFVLLILAIVSPSALCDPIDGKKLNVSDNLILITYSAFLITGGWAGLRKLWSVEMFLPSANKSCTLPGLPEERFSHTQDGTWACGGDGYGDSCSQWSNGSWTRSYNLGRERRDLGRAGHVSWATASGVYLMGGQYSKETSELVKEDGSVEEGFKLRYKTE